MRTVFVLIGIMVMAAGAHGATYEWSDSQGVVHFTDDPDRIPDKYRLKARELNVQPVTGEKESTSPPPPAAATIPAPAKAVPSYGGHDEEWWRSSFQALRDEIKTIQDNLPGKRDKLAVLGRKRTLYHKATDRTAFNELNAGIEKDEARITDLQKRLAELETAAATAAVPLEWRQ
jgi:Domain of unknown function (DUF4124)